MQCNSCKCCSLGSHLIHMHKESFVYEVCNTTWLTGTCNRKSINIHTQKHLFAAFTVKVNSSLYKLSETYSSAEVSVSQLVPQLGASFSSTLLQCKFLWWRSYMTSATESVLQGPPFHTQACLSGRSVSTALVAWRFLQLRPCMVRDQFESGWEEGQLGTVKAPVVKLTWEQVFILRTSIIRAEKEWKAVRAE